MAYWIEFLSEIPTKTWKKILQITSQIRHQTENNLTTKAVVQVKLGKFT